MLVKCDVSKQDNRVEENVDLSVEETSVFIDFGEVQVGPWGGGHRLLKMCSADLLF